MNLGIRGCLGVLLSSWKNRKMTDENYDLATKVMGKYINSKDPIEYTKDELISVLLIDEEVAAELAKMAYKEWLDAYSGW